MPMTLRSGRVLKYKKNPQKKTIAKVAKAVRSLKKRINAEVKSYDVLALNGGITTATTQVTQVSAIAQGDLVTNREGNEIRLSSINFKAVMSVDQDVRFSFLRVVLVMDKQQIADTTPSWLDVFETGTTYSHTAIASRGRFKILYDKVHCLAGQTLNAVAGIGFSGGGTPNRQFTWYKKLSSKLRFNGTAGTDIQKNGLYVMAISGDAAGDGPGITLNSRLNFYDN